MFVLNVRLFIIFVVVLSLILIKEGSFPTCLLSALDTGSKKILEPEKALYLFPLGKCIRVFRSKLQGRWASMMWEMPINQTSTADLSENFETIWLEFSLSTKVYTTKHLERDFMGSFL